MWTDANAAGALVDYEPFRPTALDQLADIAWNYQRNDAGFIFRRTAAEDFKASLFGTRAEVIGQSQHALGDVGNADLQERLHARPQARDAPHISPPTPPTP